jgi:DNA-binding GntR family transcriptional regulator
MAPETPLQRVPLREQIHAILRERILTGEIAPGEIVKDVHVAEALGASRTPVREALVRLTSEGMLINAVGRGFRAPPLVRRDVEEAHPLIVLFEPMALDLSPPLRPARLKRLDELCKRMDRITADPVQQNALDSLWHQTLIEDCPNRRLLKYIEEQRDTLRRYELAHLREFGDEQLSSNDHREIAAAERNGERAVASRLLTEHWNRGRDELLARIPAEEQE